MSHSPSREAIIDSVLRLLQAIDDNDAALLASALTDDAVLDMSGLSVITGKPMPLLKGIEMATAVLLDHGVGQMDTGHVASNFRVEMKDDVAQVSVMYVANHYRKGEGVVAGKTGLTAGNRGKWEIVEVEGGVWKIRKVEIKVLWCEGDLGVFAP